MATYKTGLRQYSDRSSRLIVNVEPTVILLDRDLQEGNWLTFYSRTKSRMTRQEQFNWDVDDLLPQSDTLSAAVTGTTNTLLPVTNITYWSPGTTWMNKRTGEIVYVEGANTTTGNVTVIRAITALASAGGTAAAAMVSGDTMVKLATLVGEDNRRQTPHHSIPTAVSNYCQQFRKDLGMTERQQKRSFESAEAERPYLLEKQMLEFRRELNAAFLVGEKGRYTDSVMGDTTTTAGIRPVISTYTLTVSGTLYQAAWNTWLVNSGMRKGSRNKLLVASNAVILAFTEMCNDLGHFNLEMGMGSTSMGIQVLTYMAPNGGQIMIVEDRYLSENFSGEAYLLDMSKIERRVFSNHGKTGEIRIIPNTGDPDDLGSWDTLAADLGLMYGPEAAHGKITGVTGGAKGAAAA